MLLFCLLSIRSEYLQRYFYSSTNVCCLKRKYMFPIFSQIVPMDVLQELDRVLPHNLAANFPSGQSQHCRKKTYSSPKGIFPNHHHNCKRGTCKTVDRTLRTTNKLNYDSFYQEFWIQCGSIFVKLKSDVILVYGLQAKRERTGWASKGNTTAYIQWAAQCRSKPVSQELFFFFFYSACISQVILIELNGQYFCSIIQLL